MYYCILGKIGIIVFEIGFGVWVIGGDEWGFVNDK